MTFCAVHLIGRPYLLSPGTGQMLPMPDRVVVLCALLAFSPLHQMARGDVARLLWADTNETRRQQNLRQFLNRLRKREHADAMALFEIDLRWIRLSPDLGVDLLEVLATARIADAAHLRDVTALWRGELLEEVTLHTAELRSWLEEKRKLVAEHLAQLVFSATGRIGGSASIQALGRLAAVRPYDEAACRSLMLNLASSGDRNAAHRVYLNFAERLRRDLSLSPDPSTAALDRDIAGPLVSETASARPLAIPESRLSQRRERQVLRAGLPRLALLPPSGQKADEAGIAVSLIEDVTLSLCRLRSLAVIAPYTSQQLASKGPVSGPAGPAVDYLVQTHLAPAMGGSVRLIATLTAQSTGQILLREAIAITPELMAGHHARLVARITDLLGTAIEQNELEQETNRRSPRPYHLYLLGRKHLRALDLVGIRRARGMFVEALDAAPEFSLAQSWTARTFILEWVLRGHSDSDLLDAARQSAQAAVVLDITDANAHRELGRAATFTGDVETSGQEMALAETYSPGNADILADFADTLVHNSDLPGAKARIEAALELNPLPPDTYWWTAGEVQFFLGEYQAALEALSRMREPAPALKLMAASAVMAGEKRAAADYRQRFLQRLPNFTIAGWVGSVPIRDRTQLRHYTEALRAAGFN